MKRRKLDSEYIHGLGMWPLNFTILAGSDIPKQSLPFFRSDDLDELEVYGADTKGTELASYSFEVQYIVNTTVHVGIP